MVSLPTQDGRKSPSNEGLVPLILKSSSSVCKIVPGALFVEGLRFFGSSVYVVVWFVVDGRMDGFPSV